MAAVPIYVWNGTAWQETGPTIPASPIKYQTTAPTSPSTGDIWIDSDADVTTGSQQFQRFRFVASGGETTISGADANGAVLAYTAGLEQVVLNGAVLVRGHDYTATNGTSITGLSPALVASDVLEVFSFIAFTVANTYTQTQTDAAIALANKVLQTVSATDSSVTTSSSTTYVDTGLTANITPSSSSNKVLVMVTATVEKTNGNAGNSVAYRLRRDSNTVWEVLYICSTDTAVKNIGTVSMVWLDSPATTSTITYKTQIANMVNASQVNDNPGGVTGSSIILMEVKP